MINTIDIKKIFAETWGYIGLPFPVTIIDRLSGTPQNYAAEKFDRFNANFKSYRKNISEKGVSIYTSLRGIDVFMPVWLSEQVRDAQEYLLPNTVMSLSNKVNIVTTHLVNRNASVKEEISMDDWQIDIKGVIVGSDNNYPDHEVQMLTKWYKKGIALNIQNARTAICLGENEKVVMTNLKFPELRGFENTQPYEFSLISDVEFSLYIN